MESLSRTLLIHGWHPLSSGLPHLHWQSQVGKLWQVSWRRNMIIHSLFNFIQMTVASPHTMCRFVHFPKKMALRIWMLCSNITLSPRCLSIVSYPLRWVDPGLSTTLFILTRYFCRNWG
jgi:hypothetical protein